MARTPAPVIERMVIEPVTPHTVVLKVHTSAPVHLVWPYVRASGFVPDSVRAVSSVWTRKTDTDNYEEVRAALINDVSWRWDRGYVAAAKYNEGWVFAWSSGEKD